MADAEYRSSTDQMEAVVNIAVALVDYTCTFERCQDIPELLSSALGIENMTFGVMRQFPAGGEPQFVICSSSGQIGASKDITAVQRYVGGICREALPLLKGLAPHLALAYHVQRTDHPFLEEREKSVVCFRRAFVVARAIDSTHHMFLVVHRYDHEADLDADATDNLRAVGHELSKQLYCMIAGHRSPYALGEPFTSLSACEWGVLQSLNSDLSEKQIAEQLNMRPHTLHSHIKSIYQKIKVQGRLPLLVRFNGALRKLRMQNRDAYVKSRMNPLRELVEVDAVAGGRSRGAEWMRTQIDVLVRNEPKTAVHGSLAAEMTHGERIF